MRWQGSNVNPMLVLRNAVCNRDWQQTWMTARAHRAIVRRRERQADSQQRLSRAFWTLAYWSVRLTQLSQPSVSAVPVSAIEAGAQPPVRRLGTGYSWRQPFLRRPPSTPVNSPGTCAKKMNRTPSQAGTSRRLVCYGILALSCSGGLLCACHSQCSFHRSDKSTDTPPLYYMPSLVGTPVGFQRLSCCCHFLGFVLPLLM
jgi:hypothetical protein